ncbi:MAG TPA: hypothetical protein VNF47_06235 [Streptosporangiaceae bacterium]|nr:hypothetical protein [Streptosporangiaceae bacterium]
MEFGSGPRRTAKIAFPADKADWHPSVLPGPIVLVSTVDKRGEPNIAPKSWISMMAFRGRCSRLAVIDPMPRHETPRRPESSW